MNMTNVTITFVGFKPDKIAEKFYVWIVDGGLEDGIIDTLSDNEIKVEGMIDFNPHTLQIAILSKNPSEPD